MCYVLRYALLLPVILLALGSQALPSDQEQLIKIEADEAFHDEKKGLTRYSGDVVMQQGSLKIKAEKVEFKSDASGNMSALSAKGNPAQFQQQPEKDQPLVKGQAKIIQYHVEDEKISFIGDAFIQQGEAQLNSEKITYNLNEQIFKAERSPSQQATEKPQRVEMIIPPKTKPQQEKK